MYVKHKIGYEIFIAHIGIYILYRVLVEAWHMSIISGLKDWWPLYNSRVLMCFKDEKAIVNRQVISINLQDDALSFPSLCRACYMEESFGDKCLKIL